MKLHNWKIFNKAGSPLNWFEIPDLALDFGSPTGREATGYVITDPSGFVSETKITSGGFLYQPGTTTVAYSWSFEEGTVDITNDVSVFYKDVSVFNPDPTNTESITEVTISPLDVSTQFRYPSATYSSAVFLKPVSQGLVETEHLFFLEDASGTLIRPYDASNSIMVFQMVGVEDEISMFIVDEDAQEIVWSDELVFDLSEYVEGVPLTVNVGFRATEEGVYERRLRAFHIADGVPYLMAEIVINAEAIGEDERFRTLLANFGLPDPKNTPKLFKQTDINEDLPDWEVLNYKSKHMILEHDKIMPFVGSYKGLVNAIKWLGYDDVFVREWFLDTKTHKQISLVVPYDAKDRAQTVLRFSPAERQTMKKLNQLSLNYCLTRETEEIDDWGTPITENCYEYNINEVFVKLSALKDWLEEHIIGVQARIIDITGEGVYFERYRNLAYSTANQGYVLDLNQSLTPYFLHPTTELLQGDASVSVSLRELVWTKFKDMSFRFLDTINYLYEVSTGKIYSTEDPSIANYFNDPGIIKVGPTFGYPIVNVNEVTYRISTEKTYAGALDTRYVTHPLLIRDNKIRYYDVLDASSFFYDSSTDLTVLIEEGFLRDASEDVWVDSLAYSIYPDPCFGYAMESSLGVITYFSDYVVLLPDTSSLLEYTVDDNYRVPLLSFTGFRTTDADGVTQTFTKKYHLDIIDGKIAMTDASRGEQVYVNFNYDTSLDEQQITLNVVYTSPRTPLFVVDPSWYYAVDPSGLAGSLDPSVLAVDNSTHSFHVNHIGTYNLEAFAYDKWNAPFHNISRETHRVWIKNPTIHTLLDTKCSTTCTSCMVPLDDVSTWLADNDEPIFDRLVPLQGLTVQADGEGRYYVEVPSITFFQDTPEPGSYADFYNLTERVTAISGTTITIDPDFQTFYADDLITLVQVSRFSNDFWAEASAQIMSLSGNDLTLDAIPVDFVTDPALEYYVLNDTLRSIDGFNDASTGWFVADVSGYEFRVNQTVGILATDVCTGYTWGATYRVLDSSGITHYFDATVPQFLLDASTRYEFRAKHAFSTYAQFLREVDTATEESNTFRVYLTGSGCVENYLDSTFIFVSVPFDQNAVTLAWFDSTESPITSDYWCHAEPISVDPSTLVILRSYYDPSTYLLGQRNIWTLRENESKRLVFTVFNDVVPYVFSTSGYYDVEVESYDSFGNLARVTYEGLIHVKDGSLLEDPEIAT